MTRLKLCRQKVEFDFLLDSDECLECGEDEDTLRLYSQCLKDYEETHISIPNFESDENEEEDEPMDSFDVFEKDERREDE